ncbi:MAG: M48 family metalloprotease [Sphingobacteriales bacterium]|jgi:predicted Zn-dependent protease|nr:M48 family metalloprotease [Sphingobacteriales bacterium]MBP9140105.1 M48 family metalloprotease [Chitinophagales bacterium]MDA0198219.1 M48 family metalloprotease [Bacteroidota bacterium]MBK6889966.1 M48 family metalloprotease [Sphingobacteriales bacterium]MBK7527510.1 M48 family metalloprotease [Sphingobacteriales bacterium]
MRFSGKARIVAALIMAAVAILSYYSKSSVNPITGEVQRVSITPEQEMAMGLQSAPEMAQQFGGLYPDQAAQNYVKQVGQKLVQSTDAARSPYKFDFHLLADDQTVNAFALPGGQIFITVALLSRLTSEDELAGVLGHEIGHVIGRHSAEHMAQSELMQGLVQATQVATYDPNNPMGSAQIAQYVGQMINMKYGREDELESDKFGVKYMYQASYNPEALIKVMEILKQASGGGQRDEFMSSHPSPDNRMEQIRHHIEAIKNGTFK